MHAAAVIRELVQILEQALEQLQAAGLTSDSTYARAVALLGFCYDHLGQPQEAIQCDSAACAAMGEPS